jgi:hypothetical protein
MKRTTLIVIAGAVVAAGVAAGAVALAQSGGDPSDATSTGVRSTQNPHDVATYWTDERMRNAKGG